MSARKGAPPDVAPSARAEEGSPEKPAPAVLAGQAPVYQRVFYLLALGTLVCLILTVGATLLIPLTVGAFLAMLLAPAARWVEGKLGRLVGAVVPVLAMIVATFVFSGLAVRQIISIGGSLEDAHERITTYINRVDRFLRWHLNLDESVMEGMSGERVVEFLQEHGGGLLSMMGGFAGSVFGAFVVPVFTFFFLFYRKHLLEFLIRLLRRSSKAGVERGAEESRAVAQKYLVGLMTVVGILAVLNSTALFLIGVEHAIFFGVFAAMLNVVPFFGPIFGSILPTLFVLLTKDSLYYPLAVIGAFVLIQMLESNVLTPKIIGRNLRLNPLVIFSSLLAGGLIWGVIGMIIVIPILSIAMQLFRLSPGTEPFAFLLGEPAKTKKPRPSLAKKRNERK